MNILKKKIKQELAFWVRKVLGKTAPMRRSSAQLRDEWKRIHARKALPAASAPRPAQPGKRILFVTGNGLNTTALSLETLLLKSLQVRGHECFALICGKGMPSCEFNAGGSGALPGGDFAYGYSRPARSKMCDDCTDASAETLRALGADVRALGEFGTDSDWKAAREIAETIPLEQIRTYVYKGIHVGDHAFSSTIRVTLRGEIDFADARETWVYRRQFMSAMVMVDRFSRCLDALRPDKVVEIHGVYLTHGIPVDVCNQKGVDVVVYGAPYRKGTLWLSHKETYHKSLVTDPNSNWEGLELTGEMEKVLDEYLGSKTAGGRDNVNYHPNPIVEGEAIASSLGLDPSKPLVSMFTNVIWDAQIYYQFNAFENIFDWIFSTIEYFGKHPELQLAIRIHPAETKGGFATTQPMAPEIRKRFPTLPSNVFVIPPESDISSYTLAEMSRATLIYGTKMGLEIALRGIPVIVAGETFNRRKGFTYDVETRPQYFELLDHILELPRNSPEMIERARKFAYYLFFQRMIDMPLVSQNFYKVHRGPDERFYNFESLDALAAGKDGNLDVICDAIISGSPFIVR